VVKHLVNEDITGAGIIAAFHERRVLPLMRRACRLDKMVPNVPLEGTVLMTRELDREEIKKHIGQRSGAFLLTPLSTSTHQCVLMMVSSRW
jgi:hypothetical protein